MSAYVDHQQLKKMISHAMQQTEEPKQAKITGMLVSLLYFKLSFTLGLTVKQQSLLWHKFNPIVNFSSCYTCRTLGWKDTSMVGNHGDILLKDT